MVSFEEYVANDLGRPPDGVFTAKITGYRATVLKNILPAFLVTYEADNGFTYTQRVGDFEDWPSRKTNFTRVQFMEAIGLHRSDSMPKTLNDVRNTDVVITVKTNGPWQNVSRVLPFTTDTTSFRLDASDG